MNVSAIIVTRGDVDLESVLDSLPAEWEKVVWDNSPLMTFAPEYHWRGLAICAGPRSTGGADLGVYGRYAAVKHTTANLIYVQDDDVIVSDPQELVDAWDEMETLARIEQTPDSETAFLVANMPQEFRHDGYTDSALVGFGAVFHRDAPARAFWKWACGVIEPGVCPAVPGLGTRLDVTNNDWFRRTCDVVFTTLTPRVLVDVPKTNLPWAEDDSRMYRQPGHVEERTRMLELARQVRDA